MTSVRFLLGTALLACLAASGCSKTEDVAPETRAFGDPPAIHVATLDAGTGSQLATCDFTDAAIFWLQHDASLDVSLAGPISLGVAYNELTFTATVTDPNSTPQKTDILLVSASFVDPNTLGAPGSGTKPNEKTLILFDDGSQIQFPYSQTAGIKEDCKASGTVFIPGTDKCDTATYQLKSGDSTAKDGLYMRKFSLVPLKTQNLNAQQLAQDCVASVHGESPQSEPPGSALSFRIDAVDREGNLTTYGTRLTTTVGPSTFVCSGDDCFCCYILLGTAGVEPGGACRGLAGMQGPAYPDGYCNSISLGL